MSKLDNMMDMAKWKGLCCKKEEKKEGNVLVKIFAIVGVLAAVAGIAYLIYRHFSPNYLEDFEDDFEDDFDDEDEDDDDFYEDETEV